MKYSFFVFFPVCLLVMLTVDGQNNAGVSRELQEFSKQDKIKLESFFEWVLNATFSVSEKSAFERQLDIAVKNRDKKSIDAFYNTLKIRDQEQGFNSEQKEAFLKNVRPLLYEKFNKQTDSTSIILLAIHKRGQENLVNNETSTAPKTDRSIIAEWTQSDMSAIGFTNGTGGVAPASGERTSMRFFSDGSYKSAYFNQSSLYNCTTTIFGLRKGRYHIIDGTIYLDEQTSDLSTKDNCRASGNTLKHPPLKHIKYVYFIINEADGPRLHLKLADGSDDIFYLEPGKGLLGGN